LLAFAAQCLGRVGRRTAVLQLHDLKTEYFGISFTADVVKDAIARIQARLPESEVGALVLTSEEKEKGQVSLSSAKQRAMSLKNKS
jgi:hypothetical protein